ncbi:MAG: mitochondrial inner membrane protein required for protein import [Trichoglossum hirsutum]|nr:MAG: mitochondrial inner membrane protein required for protein import [Trichoglossum hirsutum]
MLSRVAVRAAKSYFIPFTHQQASSAIPRIAGSQYIRGFAKDNTHRPGQRRPIDYSTPPGVPPLKKPKSGQQAVGVGRAGGTPGTAKPENDNRSEELDYSNKRDGFQTPASPESSDVTSSTASGQTQQLPDLTKGIPSTLDYETTGSTSPSKPSTAPDLSITAAAGGRDGNDLPKSAYISSVERRRNRVANFMYAGFVLFSITGAIYLGRDWETAEEEQVHSDAPSGWGLGLFYNRAKARLHESLDYYNEPAFPKLLPDPDPAWERPYTLVLSLEDLLLHSEWTREHGWRMAKRPGVDYFLRYLSQYYELVIFTSTPSMIAEPVIRKLDPYRIVMWPLFREATRYKDGEYIKDLSYLNRDLSKVILLDTNPTHVKYQPENAVILPKFTGSPNDKELVSLIPFLEYVATMGTTDIRTVLKSFEGKHIPTEFARREAIARVQFQKQLAEERAKRPKRSGMGILGNALGIKPMGTVMVSSDGTLEQSAAEAFEQGKMMQDIVRERGQRQYELLEKEIRENGEKLLKEWAAEEEKAKEEQMKGMTKTLASVFGGGGGGDGGGAK